MILSLLSCITLDTMLPFHNGVHCSVVEEEDWTCDPEVMAQEKPTYDPYWDLLCRSCDEDYEWDRAVDWTGVGELKRIFDDVSSVEPVIDPQTVQRVSIEAGQDVLVILDAYFIPSHGQVAELVNTTIIYNHGRYGGIEHYLPRVQILHALGYNVFVWDYRGYGKSVPAAFPTPEEWMSDTQAVYEAAAVQAPDPSKLIIYGMSTGGYAAGEMADKNPACAVFFEAAGLSNTEKVEDNLSVMIPFPFISSGLLETDIKFQDVQTPVLLMHGTRDRWISFRSAQAFYDGLPEDTPKHLEVYEDGGHTLGNYTDRDGMVLNGIPEMGIGRYRDVMMDFLEEKASSCLD